MANFGEIQQIPDMRWKDLTQKYGEDVILSHYFSVKHIPILICSPWRKDRHPSFSLFVKDERIYFKDFATGEKGNLLDFLIRLTNKTKEELVKEVVKLTDTNSIIIAQMSRIKRLKPKADTIIKVRFRTLNSQDFAYWASYGIDASILVNYDIYPIDYYWIYKGNAQYRRQADPLAYAYREVFKRPHFKVYQPMSKRCKWTNDYPPDTIALERYIGDYKPIVICSSVKDALALKSCLDCDVCALQGEGYKIPQWFADKYKTRDILICFDNDERGLLYAKTLSEETGYINKVLPPFEGGKDISDYVKCFGKDKAKATFTDLFYPQVINNPF